MTTLENVGKVLSLLNEYSGLIGLFLAMVVVPWLRKLSQEAEVNIENVSLQRIIRGITAGAEYAARGLVENRLGSRQAAIQLAIDYAREKFPESFQVLNPDEATVQQMAATIVDPVLDQKVKTIAAAPVAEMTAPTLVRAAVPDSPERLASTLKEEIR